MESQTTEWIDVVDPVRRPLGLPLVHSHAKMIHRPHKHCSQRSLKPQARNLRKRLLLPLKLLRLGANRVY